MSERTPVVAAGCIAAGVCLVAAIPPWGWWPLAVVGIALLDLLVADQPAPRRFRRTWLTCAVWLGIGMVWMWDLTPPGYVVATVVFAAYFAVAVALSPGGRARRLALPAAFVLAEAIRGAWPFGGVPLATIPHGQVAGVLGPVVRIAGPLLLVALTVIVGQALAAAWQRHVRDAAAGSAVVLVVVLLAGIAPTAEPVEELRVAVVQGGGPQRTRAAPEDRQIVFGRHLEASEDIEGPVDLIVWPENVVHIGLGEDGSPGVFEESPEAALLGELARRHDATVVVGVIESLDARSFANTAFVIDPSGEVVDRYDKVRRVPFGEMVPLRDLVERFSGSVPGKDARIGTEPGVVATPVGDLAVAISWEVFFTGRVREGVQLGGDAVINPTNGSSYWLTIVQSQQVASSRLRALETDRWVIQAAPTGFSGLIAPDGTVVERTAVSERRVVHGTIERREGLTWATRLGDAPMVVVALVALAVAWGLSPRRSTEVDRSVEVH